MSRTANQSALEYHHAPTPGKLAVVDAQRHAAEGPAVSAAAAPESP